MRIPVAGVGISHPDRVMFPEAGITKVDLARYYESIADWILPQVEGRPLTLVRCPEGVGPGGSRGRLRAGCFYMKHSKVWAPPALRRVRIREKLKTGEYLVADSLAAVIGLVQMDVLEIHTWNSRISDLERPDRVVIDLDPGRQVAWPAVVDAARLVRDLLAAVDLDCCVKTTGGRGLHVVVPLRPRAGWAETLAFARAVAEALVRRDPRRFTTRFAKRGRARKLLVDYLRNNRANTSVAAYSTRARPDAPVSTPLAWRELSAARPPDRFTLHAVSARLARRRRDPWNGCGTARQTLARGAVAALDRL